MKIKLVGMAFVGLLLTILGMNAMLNKTAHKSLADENMHGLEYKVQYRNYIDIRHIVFDVRNKTDEIAPVEVFKAFAHTATDLQEKSFETVTLASNGVEKFFIYGEHFSKLGTEFKTSNPMFWIRTLPENTYRMNGERAFEQWSGGLIGVLTKQMQDFTSLHQQWLIDDAIEGDKN